MQMRSEAFEVSVRLVRYGYIEMISWSKMEMVPTEYQRRLAMFGSVSLLLFSCLNASSRLSLSTSILMWYIVFLNSSSFVMIL